MFCYKYTILSLILVLALSGNLKAQNLDAELFFGLGPAISKNDLALNLGTEVQTKFGLVQLRVSGIHEGIRILPEEEPSESSIDISLLVGKRINLNEPNNAKGGLSFSVLVGIGEITIIKQGDQISEGTNFGSRKFEKIEHHESGFSYEISFSSRSEKLGAKIALVGNLNEIESYSGITGGFILKIF